MTMVFGLMIGRICAFLVLSANPVLADHARIGALCADLNEADHDNFPQGGAPAVSEDHAARSRRALRGVLPYARRCGASALERLAADNVRVGSRAAARHEVRGMPRARRVLRSRWSRRLRSSR